MNQIARTLLFDFDHTLGIDNRLEERVLRGLAIRYCQRVPTDADIADALDSFRSGRISLDTMVEEAVSSWGGHATQAVAQEYRAVAVALVPGSVEPMPGARELFAMLENYGARHAIFSNGWSALQAAKAAAVGYLGRVITSEEVGAWKPDAAAFQRGAAEAGFEARTTLYVGDSPVTDVAGAKSAGMQAAWADLEGKAYPQDIVKPDHIVTWLPDVVGLLSE
ncbi:MAG TPA: HAD family hydrolase [Candidatus Eremiobacteraceae bacterium]